MADKPINFSIIIPHKNIPLQLQRCLDSIPKREDTEVIIVDDNSSYDLVKFEKFPGLNEKNTDVIFSKESKGAGFARNLALAKAKGRWLIFADADDFFTDCLNTKMDEYKESDADIIFFQSESADSDTLNRIESRGRSYNLWLTESVKKQTILNDVRYNINPPWSKFYSRSFIEENQIRFDEVLTANDVMFSTRCGYHAKKVHIDLDYLYCSTARPGSLDTTYNIEHIKPRFEVALAKYQFLSRIGEIKYRVNIWYIFNTVRKLDPNWFGNYFIPTIKIMRIDHLINDFLFMLRNKITKSV